MTPPLNPSRKKRKTEPETEAKSLVFMSYTRKDNIQSYGKLEKIRGYLQGTFSVMAGEEISVFMDLVDLETGQKWEKTIKNSLDQAMVMIPIITPSYFNSDICRRELEWFLDREDQLNRHDLIFPFYYVDCPLLENKTKRDQDKLARMIAERQWGDLRSARLSPLNQKVKKRLEYFALPVLNVISELIEKQEQSH
jgi:hypothetical protein